MCIRDSYYAYPTPNGIQTPVPEGYSPFYVSHYGRHGSRWMTSDERYLEVIRVFDTFQDVYKRQQYTL